MINSGFTCDFLVFFLVILNVRFFNVNVSWLRALNRTDNAAFFQDVDQPGCPVISDSEPSLQERRRRFLRFDDVVLHFFIQRIVLSGDHGCALIVINAFQTDKRILVARLHLRGNEVGDPLDLLVGNIDALQAHRTRFADREIKHIAVAQQTFRPDMIENRPGIDTAGNGEGDPAWNVGLDDTGNDIRRRPLRRDDQMNAGGTRQLRDPLDRKSTRLNSSHSGESRMPSSA